MLCLESDVETVRVLTVVLVHVCIPPADLAREGRQSVCRPPLVCGGPRHEGMVTSQKIQSSATPSSFGF